MNEQAVRLYEQAVEFAYDTIGIEHANTAYFQGVIAGKFAELLVRECKSVLLDMMDESQGDGDTLDLALTEINEHFGVEE
jgi:hypothetical protein